MGFFQHMVSMIILGKINYKTVVREKIEKHNNNNNKEAL